MRRQVNSSPTRRRAASVRCATSPLGRSRWGRPLAVAGDDGISVMRLSGLARTVPRPRQPVRLALIEGLGDSTCQEGRVSGSDEDSVRRASGSLSADDTVPMDVQIPRFRDILTSDDESESGLASSESEAESSDPAFMDPTVESLATSLYDAAVATEPSIAPRQEPASARRPSLQTMAASLLRSKTFAGLTELMMVGDLRHVTRYLNDSRLKDAILNRLNEQIPPQTVVLVAHSFGSIAAYEYLCRYRPPAVRLFITLGSPLGTPNLVFDKLTPRPVKGVGAWPGLVERWVNVADPDDVIALREGVRSAVPSAPRGTARGRSNDR